LKIAEIRTTIIKIPVLHPYVASFGVIDSAENVIVEIISDNGLVGVGECCPIVGFSDEYSCSIKILIDNYLSPVLIGEDPVQIEKLDEKMEKALKGNLLAKAGVNMALYDLMGKYLELPVYKLLGGKFVETVPEAMLISKGDPIEEVAEAQRAVQNGYRIFKLKVGARDPKIDINRVAAIREAIGDGISIRVDANQAWSPAVAIKIIKKMERYDLDYVEQPVPASDIEGMMRVSRSVETPILADESLQNLYDALKLIQMRAADFFNIKVPKHGGITWSKKILAIAETANIPFFTGCLAGTSITIAASLHLICSTRLKCLGISRLALKDDIVANPLKAKNGEFEIPSSPGLGIELDENKVQRYTVRGFYERF
jgi:muconate cycloisomerase